jgi:hypothetical protein
MIGPKKKAYLKAYRNAHREKITARDRTYYLVHREEVIERTRAYHEKHREEIAAKKKLYRLAHRNEIAVKEKIYHGMHRKEYDIRTKTYRSKLKKEVMEAYGGKCACCGENLIEFLTIDHINGGGNKHRRALRIGSGSGFYCWLKKNNFPTGFQVLCHNCNIAKGHYGRCPHENEKVKS